MLFFALLCLPPKVLADDLNPTGARLISVMQSEAGQWAYITEVRYRTALGKEIRGYWAGDRLVAMDLTPDTEAALWHDWNQWARPGVLAADRPMGCNWKQQIPPRTR